MKIGGGPLEYRSLEYREALDVPLPHIIFIRVEVDAKVEVVCGHGGAIPRRPLQDVEPFENQDLGLVYGLKLSWDDIIQLMGVDRYAKLRLPFFELRQKHQHSFEIIALWKALTTHQVSIFKNCGWPQEAVCRDQFYRSTCLIQQGAENPGEGALSNGYAAGHRDHERMNVIGLHL